MTSPLSALVQRLSDAMGRATPGTWDNKGFLLRVDEVLVGYMYTTPLAPGDRDEGPPVPSDIATRNAEFLAAAANAAPVLLAALGESRAEGLEEAAALCRKRAVYLQQWLDAGNGTPEQRTWHAGKLVEVEALEQEIRALSSKPSALPTGDTNNDAGKREAAALARFEASSDSFGEVNEDRCFLLGHRARDAEVAALVAENKQLARDIEAGAELIERVERDRDALVAERDALRISLGEARGFAEEAAAKYNALLADGKVLRCAFCDAEYPSGTPPTQHEALTAHVMVCDKHPMRDLERKTAAHLGVIETNLATYGSILEECIVHVGAQSDLGSERATAFLTRLCSYLEELAELSESDEAALSGGTQTKEKL